MTLQYIKDMSHGGRLADVEADEIMRLYGFDKTQAIKFRTLVQSTVIDGKKQLDLSAVDFIERMNCNLTLRLADEDLGITRESNKVFFCDLTKEGYLKMLELIEPFCGRKSHGFTWLYDLDTPIEFLFSPEGTEKAI